MFVWVMDSLKDIMEVYSSLLKWKNKAIRNCRKEKKNKKESCSNYKETKMYQSVSNQQNIRKENAFHSGS